MNHRSLLILAKNVMLQYPYDDAVWRRYVKPCIEVIQEALESESAPIIGDGELVYRDGEKLVPCFLVSRNEKTSVIRILDPHDPGQLQLEVLNTNVFKLSR